MTCNILKIFRVARYKRIDLEVNLINLPAILLTRDTCVFISPSMQSAKVNEARGGVDVLIWDGTEDCIITFLKLLAVFSGKYIGTCVSRFSTIYRIYIRQSRRFVAIHHLWASRSHVV